MKKISIWWTIGITAIAVVITAVAGNKVVRNMISKKITASGVTTAAEANAIVKGS